jgi:pimeloyl-ACP methyl ester carboxylesterase
VKLLRSVFIVAIVYLLFSAVVGYFLIEGAVHPYRKKLSEKSAEKANAIALRAHSKMQNVSVSAADCTKLRAWYFESPEPSSKTVLLFHGLSDNRGGMVGYSLFLLRDHYNVLVPDWRAHGESEGKLASYGLIETNDVKAWIDFLQENGDQSFYALGESYGAAILLQTLAKENRICAAVAESSFASFREAAYDRLGQPLGFSDKVGRTLFLPIAEAGLLAGSWKYQFNFAQVYPLQSLRTSTTPVLLIHGDADTNLPVRHSRLMYSLNRNRSNLEYWEPAGAEHSSTHGKYRGEFESRVLAWFEKHRCEFNTKSQSH